MDLAKFFDRVNHDCDGAIVAADRGCRVLGLIRRYLVAEGDGRRCGGGATRGRRSRPAVALLANVLLDEVDKALEQRARVRAAMPTT